MSTWDYAHCLPYFQRLETSDIGESGAVRGYNGPQRLERGPVTNPLFQTFFEAAQQAGFPRTPDINGTQPEGFTAWERTIDRGRRLSVAGAFLHPAERRPNLEVRTGCLTTKLLLDGKRVTGVRYEDRARRRVDVKAGKVVLAERRVQLPAAAPALRHRQRRRARRARHPRGAATCPASVSTCRTTWWPRSSTAAPSRSRSTRSASKWRWPLYRAAVAVHPPRARRHEHLRGAAALVRTHSEITYPDLLLGFAPLAMRFDPHIPDRGYQLMMASMRPAARGTVKITSTDPRKHPALKFNYLGNDVDRRFWVDAVHIARDAAQPARVQGAGRRRDLAGARRRAPTRRSSTGSPAPRSPTCTLRRRARLGTDERIRRRPAHDGGARDRGARGGRRLRDAALPEQRDPRADDDARREGGGPDPRQQPAAAALARAAVGPQATDA